MDHVHYRERSPVGRHDRRRPDEGPAGDLLRALALRIQIQSHNPKSREVIFFHPGERCIREGAKI